MHISEIEIKNFRVFDKFRLSLDSGLNVIVGENNSGKTALIDAIRLTLDTNSSEWTRIIDSDFHESTDTFTIKLKIDGINSNQASVFVEHLSHEEIDEDTRKSVLFVNLQAQRTNIVRKGSRYIRTELRSGENAEGPIIEREIRDYLSATYLRPLRDAESELTAGRGSRLSQILASSNHFNRNEDNFKMLLEKLIEANGEAQENPGIKKTTKQVQNQFQNLSFSGDQFQLAIQLLGSKDFSSLSDVEKERSFQSILQRLSLTLDINKPFQGLGYNNLLFMATELILLEQEKDGFPLLLIEEPEAHIHPQLQMKFLSYIRENSSATKSSNIQTILTTHSPNLASKAPLESVILMKNGQAYSMKKGETKLDPDDYVFLEKFLDVTKSNLFFAKAVLIVEGDAENILLPTIADILGRSLEDYGVSIVNVGSTAYARFAKIFMREDEDDQANWLPIKIACIRDLDLWPDKADKKNYPDIGFKERKDGNKHYWVSEKDPSNKKEELEKLSSQFVKVFVSDEWTFEYCLIKKGLSKEIFETANKGSDNYEDLPSDQEEKAVKIYGMIDSLGSGKTEVAYQLSQKIPILFKDTEVSDIKKNLPSYIVKAIEYVTSEENTDDQDFRQEVV